MRDDSLFSPVALLSAFVLASPLLAQAPSARSGRPPAANVIVPQAGCFSLREAGRLRVARVDVGVVVLEQAATTTMDIHLTNPSSFRLESELLVPVPEGAVVRGFTFQGASSEPKAELLPKEDARKAYDAIVAKIRDPALLEFVGFNSIRSSVFPVEPNGNQTVRLTYEHILPADGNRIDYVLPRSESLAYDVPWKISVKLESKSSIAAVYSPSHRIETVRSGANRVSVKTLDDPAMEPGPFRLSCLVEECCGSLPASLFAYPDAKAGGGYFLLLAGLPPPPKDNSRLGLKREVTIVIDCSGSMRGEKLEQVREAALEVLSALQPGEAFNIIAYSESVNLLSKEPVIKTEETVERGRSYLRSLVALSGTNIHDALVEALRQKPAAGFLPIVLFLTDGLPTVGQTSEIAIRDLATKSNPFERRIFTFGVGVDVNTPLLEKIASESRGSAAFVLPGENVEVKVGQVFKRLTGPILAGGRLEVVDASGKSLTGRVRELLPAKLPDLFEGEQLVLLGQYSGTEPLAFQISGNHLGQERVFRFELALDRATTRNSFVPRLWASRKIGVLLDAIRQLGADSPAAAAASSAHGTPVDPRLKELVGEVVRLSTEFGILTEYTAFLATEGTDLSKKDEVLAEAEKNFKERALSTRTGLASVNQEVNYQAQATQACLNSRNFYCNSRMEQVATANIQQVADLAFYRRGSGWCDSRAVHQGKDTPPRRVIDYGTKEFEDLEGQLATEGRQACVALGGDILLVRDGEPILVKMPRKETSDK
jgi:Ca-activated chloride channel family protein